jgi:tetratricopeptide (TPR) repeat protein
MDLAGLLERLHQDQRLRWRRGERPSVEDYLECHPELGADPGAVVGLIYAEYVLRQELGEAPPVQDYLKRFPEQAESLQEQLDLHQALQIALQAPTSEVVKPTLAEPPPEVELVPPTQSPSPDWSPQALLADLKATRATLPTVAVPGYEVLGLLGKGGMGVVYKARHVLLGRTVALKMIRAAEHSTQEERRRFLAEARAVASLQHPHIVQIHEVGEHGGLPFFSLEFCPGGSLEKRLDGTPWEGQRAARLVETLARAMHTAHRAGIVHRDLKPGNVLLAEVSAPPPPGGKTVGIESGSLDAWMPKITDFGLAKRLDASVDTHSGAVLGTPSYMAPEQAQGKKSVGPAADVYALGAVLYELLTGRPPFKAATALDTIRQVISDEPVPVRRLQPRVPRDLETICHKCLEKDVPKRYASAEALADDLQCFVAGESIQARRVRPWERAARWARRRPAAAALVGVLCAVGLALAVAGVQFSAQRAQKREADQKRQNDARVEARDWLNRGQTAASSQSWEQVLMLLDRAKETVATEPALADLREEVEAARAPVQRRLAALATWKRFAQDRDDALFHATLAGGDDFQTNRRMAQEKAHAALEAVGLSREGEGTLHLEPDFSREEIAEITTGCYALLLMLAEAEARRLSQQDADEQRRRVQRALTLLKRADALGVRTRAIHLGRARYHALLGEETLAAQAREQAQALEKETDLDPQDHFLVGHEWYSQGDLKRANQEFTRALQLNPRHFWTHYFLGICCVTSGRPEMAVVHWTVCQGQKPDLVWVYLLRGFAHGQVKDYRAAEADFDEALRLKPTDAARYVLFNNRGVMRVGQKERWAEGVDDLRKAAVLRPDQHQAHASLAEAYQLKGRLEDAARELGEAIARADRHVRAGDLRPATEALLYHRLARLHLQRKDRDAAVRDLAEAARLAANDPPLRARAEADRGRVLHVQERFAEALAAYDEALKADPKRVDVIRWRGEVLQVQGDYSRAASAFDDYLDKGGAPSAAVYRQRGLAHAKVGRHAQAIDDFGRALEAKPKDEEKVVLYLARGQEHLALDAPKLALHDFEEARRLDPDNANASLACAHIRVKLGDLKQGTADAENAVKGDPKEPRLWHGAARVYAQAAAQWEKGDRSREESQAVVQSRYQRRAIFLLRKALTCVPADQRGVYWRENVRKDKALLPIRDLPEFGQLALRFDPEAR